MFQHLFAGSPPWLMALAVVGVALHIGGGIVGIGSGAAALALRKGERGHRLAGTVFFAAMLTMAGVATVLAITLVVRGHASQWGNVMGGFFTLYLVATARATVRTAEGTVGRFDVAACAVGFAVAAFAAFVIALIGMSPAGRASGVPVAAPFIFAAVALLAAGSDLKVILRGGVAGVARVARHVWRMCTALFIASASFFLGQQQVMPKFIQGSPVLVALGVAPLILMVFWLVFIRRRAWSMRTPAPA
jgi:hypothetical protein